MSITFYNFLVFFVVTNMWYFFSTCGQPFFYLLLFPCGCITYDHLLAVASDKGKMPLKVENSVISLDDLVAEKIGAEGTLRSREDDHRRTQNNASVQGNQPLLNFVTFLPLCAVISF